MVGKIFINGQIGANKDEMGVNLIDVIRQVQGQSEATSFDVHINSQGGYVDVGFDIYDYLKSLKLPITTIGEGMVASIATVIFMAGDTRRLMPNTQFMIHLPSGSVEGTAQEIADYNSFLIECENRIIKFYTNTTGLTEEAIRPLLKNETWLTTADALDMKFTTAEEVVYSAVAKYEKLNTNLDTKMTKEDKDWIEQGFNAIKALFKGAPKAIKLADSNGVEIEFPNLEDGQTPAVGDEVLVDGQPASGEYIMPQLDNSKVICVDGVITEILVDVPAEGEEMEALKKRNAELEQQLAEANAKVETATATATEVETKLTTIESEFTNFKAQVTAKFESGKEERKNGEGKLSPAQERLEKLKNKNK